jgi:acetyl esterase/lipase
MSARKKGRGLVAAILGAFALFQAQVLPAQPPAAAAAAAGRIPIEALARPALLTWPILSPDGNRIAARVKVGGRDWIGVWDLRDPPGSQPHLWPQSDYELGWLRWAGPNRLLLGAHGEQDRVVPVSQSRNLVRALTRAGTPPESVFYPQEAHGFTKPQDSIDFLTRVEAFLTAHNPAGTAPPAARTPQPPAPAPRPSQ